jgi:hypothetical protein
VTLLNCYYARHAWTGRTYSLTIEDAAALYARAGHPRTSRSVQRYCASGHLDAIKEATTLGDKYFINPDSVARHIAQIEELIALDNRTTSRDVSRQGATPFAPPIQAESGPTPVATSDDEPRPVATSRNEEQAMKSAPRELHYIEHLESEIESFKEDRDFLREQIKTKDEQIASLLERDRETNILVRGLQQMLSPLLGSPRQAPRRDDDERPDAPFSQ